MPKVLLVEDDDVFITLIQHHLRCHNYVVETSRSGSEGLSRLGAEVFDIAILDWVLPDMLASISAATFEQKAARPQFYF